jgi:hypothetical protein
MKRNEMFPAKFFKAADLPPAGLPVKIKGVTREPIGPEQKEKPVITFVDEPKMLVLNPTNFDLIADILGEDDTKNWVGRVIVLYPDKTPYGGKMTPCIRVKKYHKPAPVTAKPQPTEIDPPPAENIPANHDMDDEIIV